MLDPPDSASQTSSNDLYLPHINTYPDMSREIPELLKNPVAWIRDYPRGSGLTKAPIPPALYKCLTRLSPKSKDGLIAGIVLAGSSIQRYDKKIQKRRNNGRAPAASGTVKEYPQLPTRQDKRSAICEICLEN